MCLKERICVAVDLDSLQSLAAGSYRHGTNFGLQKKRAVY